MGSQQYRAELERKRKQRINAEKKVGEYRNKESKKHAEADKARQEAAKTKSASTQKSKLKIEPGLPVRQGGRVRRKRSE